MCARARTARPISITPSSTPRQTSVFVAVRALGFRNAGTPLAIASTPVDRLVTSIAMMCPFEPSEKQALLEASDLDDRARLLTAIVEMAVLNRSSEGGAARH